MKVGILSMQRVYNYGSFLQAYALKKIIEKLGHEVVFVDYVVEKPVIHGLDGYLNYVIGMIQKYVFMIIDSNPCLWNLKIIPKRIRYASKSHYKYKTVYWKELELEKKKNYHAAVDTLIIGSDEVFNCLQANVDVGFSKELFGVNSKAKRIITFAASFGNTTLSELQKENLQGKITMYLSKISAFSVRDTNTKYIVSCLTGRNDVVENLDPVLIYDFCKLENNSVELSNYIIVYAYRGRLSKNEENAIINFAHVKKKKIVCIGGYHEFCDIYIQESPLKILSYFKNADYVFTDTFHGTIFSVINHVKMGIFVRKGHGKTYGNSEKLLDLITRLHLEDRIISNLDELESLMDKTIEYDVIDSIINAKRLEAYEYLKKSIV